MPGIMDDLEHILTTVKRYMTALAPAEAESPVTRLELEPFEYVITAGPACPFVCVDGSYVDLFHLAPINANITLFRISTIEYQIVDEHAAQMKRHHVFDKLNLVTDNPHNYPPEIQETIPYAKNFTGRPLDIISNLVMYLYEENALLAAAQRYKNSIIARDGTLTSVFLVQPDEVMTQIRDQCTTNENVLVGISKDSTSHYLKDARVDEAFLKQTLGLHKLVGCEIDKKLVRARYPPNVFADIFFATLNPYAEKFFRVDVGTKPANMSHAEVLGELARYSNWEGTPGFPYPLVEAHKSAKSVRDMHEMFKKQILDACVSMDIPLELILAGIIDDYGTVAGKFHSQLDLVSGI